MHPSTQNPHKDYLFLDFICTKWRRFATLASTQYNLEFIRSNDECIIYKVVWRYPPHYTITQMAQMINKYICTVVQSQ